LWDDDEVIELQKKVKEKDSEIADLKKEVEDNKNVVEDMKKQVQDMKNEVVDMMSMVEAAKKMKTRVIFAYVCLFVVMLGFVLGNDGT
jgi:peptidoglycan hydrolase CwlO-like protein